MLQPTPRPHAGRKSNAPRPHERRATGQYPYYRLATYRAELISYRDDPHPFETVGAAYCEAERRGPGRYRISTIHEDGCRETGEPFDIKGQDADAKAI